MLHPDEDDSFEIARGDHVGITQPSEGFEARVSITWQNFVKLMTTFTVSESKTGAYVCRPMGGDGNRSDANAQPWPMLPLDLDELLPSDVNDLDQWAENFGVELILVTTFSHTAENPRVRLWIKCDRPVTANEHLFLFKALSQEMPFKLDPATAKPSQPIYLPRCPAERKNIAFSKHYTGRLLRVDALLDRFRDLIKERDNRNQGARFAGKGIRAPGGTIDAFNHNFDRHALLEAHNYKRKSNNRYVCPNSKSGRAAVVVHEWGLISFHEPDHDPLSKRDDLNVPQVLDTFAVYTILEHDDDFIPAFKAVNRMVKEKGWLGTEDVSAEPVEYRILNATEAIFSLPARHMLVDDLLDSESVTLATGQSNSGKTTVLEYLALCIAQGDKFAGRETRKGNILWIAGEDADNARFRVGGMCQEYGITHSALNDNFRILPQPVQILEPREMEGFHRSVDKYIGQDKDISLIVIDSKSVCWGGKDENDNAENADFLRKIAQHFVTRYRAAVIITHHLTKNKEKEDQTARGASALINNADHEWRFEMNANNLVTKLEPGKLRLARWDPLRFQIKTLVLSELLYPHWKNNFSKMPRISVPEVINQYGLSARKIAEDQELADVLAAIKQLPPTTNKRASGRLAIARIMGKITDDSSEPDKNAARDWVRRRVEKLVEQKLVDSEHKVTTAGDSFLESVLTGRQLTEPEAVNDPPAEREPGEDDE